MAFLLLLFTISFCYADNNNNQGNQGNQGNGNGNQVVFDYIVVGSGAGGIAVAEELSRNPSNRVALLEQGAVCTACTSLGAATQDNSVYQDRQYPVQQQFAALIRQPTDIEHKAFGGKMKLMGNVYTRPSKTFLDTMFPSALNSTNLLPYYKEMEDHYCHYLSPSVTNISAANCATYHGQGGPIQVTSQVFPVLDPVTQNLAQYARDNGFFDTDYNDLSHNGLAFEQNFKVKANQANIFSPTSRGDPQVQLLPPSVLASRPNLVVLLNAKVHRIIFDNHREAQGIEYTVNGTQTLSAYARYRVWICAGALRTPQLLQISGVGDANLLASIGVPLVANNTAVGATLKAHQAVILGYQTKNPINHNSTWGSYNVIDWWASTGLSPYPDIQIEVLEGFFVASVEPEGAFPFPVDVRFLGGQVSQPYLGMEMEMLTPSATGHVSARTPSIDEHPEWDLGWNFADFFGTSDLAKLLAGINIIRNTMIGNNVFANNNILGEVWPGNYYINQLASIGITTDAAAEAAFGLPLQASADFFFIQYALTHFFHITTTVPLGVATDLHGAVNGVYGLSVCDNGVLPANPDGNPTATTLAVCRKIAREQAALDRNYY